MRIKIFVYLFVLSIFTFTTNAGAKLGIPKELIKGDNPYKIIEKPKLNYKNPESSPWIVFANKKDAPMFRKRGRAFIKTKDTANYLEKFWVEKREGEYIQVSNKRIRKRWMKMKDLILSSRAIKDNSTHVYFRVFPSFRIDESVKKIKLDDLRFRDGPGEPGKDNSYHYLISREEIPKNAAHFLYVYSVHFEKDDNDKYLHTQNFDKADYYLVGTSDKFSLLEDNIKNTIKGWIPRKGVVLNFSRQFLEINPDRKYKYGHIFVYESNLREFFDKKDEKDKKEYIEYLQKQEEGQKVIADEADDEADEKDKNKRISPPQNGQSMRWFILDQKPRSYNNIKYLHIGYSLGEGEGGLSKLQDWAKKIRIFFLIDATTSMRPCIEAVRNIVTKFEKKGSKNIQFFSAIFRDDVDGVHRFEIWDRKGSLSSWLKKIRATDYARDSTFEESLFYGIEKAVEQWKNLLDFNTPSVKIMFILGDTGNDDTEEDSSLNQAIQALKENIIFPHAIHFKHPVQHTETPEGEAEERAMRKFETDMKEIIHGVYGELQDENICYSKVDISEITSELENQINNTITTMQTFVDEIKKVRLGQETLTKGLCELLISNAEDRKQCNECKDQEDPLKCISEFCSKKGYTKNLFIPFYLKHLIEKENPLLYEFLKREPQTGICEGWVAIEVNGEKICRPVLFLNQYEIDDIKYKILNFKRYLDVASEEKCQQYVVDVLKTILGYILIPIHPTEEELNGWLEVLIGFQLKKTEMNDPIEKIADKICGTMERKKGFAKRLDSIYQFIDTKLMENTSDVKFKKERMYKDLENMVWWWVYPDQIIAIPNRN